jgi:hypothetical protein
MAGKTDPPSSSYPPLYRLTETENPRVQFEELRDKRPLWRGLAATRAERTWRQINIVGQEFGR